MLIKQFYRKTGQSQRDRLLARFEYLMQFQFPADWPEIEALGEILHQWGGGDYVPPIAGAPLAGALPSPCDHTFRRDNEWLYCAECGECWRLDTSLHK